MKKSIICVFAFLVSSQTIFCMNVPQQNPTPLIPFLLVAAAANGQLIDPQHQPQITPTNHRKTLEAEQKRQQYKPKQAGKGKQQRLIQQAKKHNH